MKQTDSMLPCVCSVVDHRGRQNVVRTSVIHSDTPVVPLFLFLPHFDVIWDLLLNRRTAEHGIYLLNRLSIIAELNKEFPPISMVVSGLIRHYNPPINFHVILLPTLRHVA